jgi:hypothetical protein
MDAMALGDCQSVDTVMNWLEGDDSTSQEINIPVLPSTQGYFSLGEASLPSRHWSTVPVTNTSRNRILDVNEIEHLDRDDIVFYLRQGGRYVQERDALNSTKRLREALFEMVMEEDEKDGMN